LKDFEKEYKGFKNGFLYEFFTISSIACIILSYMQKMSKLKKIYLEIWYWDNCCTFSKY